jgi:pyrimidine-specific ribonucleoside hydrolase
LIFAHGVHLDAGERQAIAVTHSVIAFCSVSNLFLRRGLFPCQNLRAQGVRVGFGADVGAGLSFSLLATLAGAKALSVDDETLNFPPGKETGFIVVNPSATPLLGMRNQSGKALAEGLFILMMIGDERGINATYIAGQKAELSSTSLRPSKSDGSHRLGLPHALRASARQIKKPSIISLSAMRFIQSLGKNSKHWRQSVLGAIAALVSIHGNVAVAAPWIIDTDMGADDWIAILYAAKRLEGRIAAITVSGNGLSHCPAGRDNASSLLKLLNPSATTPVGCGSESPLDGFANYPQLWRQGSDAMMGQSLPKPSQAVLDSDLESTALLAKSLREAKAPIPILTLGTMTNLASVLTVEPGLKSKIKEVVVMAGAVDVPGNVRVHNFTEDNPNTKAEWNLYIDPVAARIVFEAGLPIRLVPLDVTNSIPLTAKFVKRFRSETTGAAAQVVGRWFEQLLKPELGEYYHWDPLAAVVALNPSLCSTTIRRVKVLANVDANPTARPYDSPHKHPLLNWRGELRQVLDLQHAGDLIGHPQGKPVQICMKVNAKAFEDKLIEGFQASPWLR